MAFADKFTHFFESFLGGFGLERLCELFMIDFCPGMTLTTGEVIIGAARTDLSNDSGSDTPVDTRVLLNSSFIRLSIRLECSICIVWSVLQS